MKSLEKLWQEVAADAAIAVGVSTTRDYETVTRRVKTEGLSFLTISLPSFASDLERSLELGRVDSDLFCGFRRKGGLPAFLSGFLRRVFDAQSGKILDEPCVDSIIAIRQLCYLFKKVEIRCTPQREYRAIQAYKECEDELKRLDSERTSVDYTEFSRMSSLLFGDCMDAVSAEIESFQLRPRHGPGATADRLRGNQKWTFPEWTDRLESVFPYGSYAVPNLRYWNEPVVHLSPGQERPVKVTLVPKTQKTPRVIAIEPTPMQYMQQGLLGSLVSKLERMTPSRHFVGFTHQFPNQDLAREGSISGTLATLDLSEASDRVSNSLVLAMTRPWPSLSDALQATRTRTALLPTGEVIRLAKFASMGSAVCFPIEAMVFTTIVFLGLQDAARRRLLPRDLVRFRGKVRVYGDDMIVPVDSVDFVIKRLESFGLKVNTAKSFWNGNFRESCGGDYYRGEWVTPIRLGQLPPKTKQDVTEVVSWIAMSNQLHKAGYWKGARYCADVVETVLGKLPVTAETSSALSLHTFGQLPLTGVRWHKDLHKPLVKAWVADAKSPRNEISGIHALHKALSGDWSDPMYREHLTRSGRPSSVKLKKRWVPI